MEIHQYRLSSNLLYGVYEDETNESSTTRPISHLGLTTFFAFVVS